MSSGANACTICGNSQWEEGFFEDTGRGSRHDGRPGSGPEGVAGYVARGLEEKEARDRAQAEALFRGLQLIGPRVALVNHWHPDADARALPDEHVAGMAASRASPEQTVRDTPRMSEPMPPKSLYHRWLGWHAPAMRRTVLITALGLVVGNVLGRFFEWELSVVAGWDAAAVAYLATIWPIIVRADSARAVMLARREDEQRGAAALLLLGASIASLLGVGFALGAAGGEHGSTRASLIAAAVVTVALSWLVVNTVFTLRYADLDFADDSNGVIFGDSDGPRKPDFRDFAYVAFTIGMCYQVSDTTLRDSKVRRTALVHALLSYLFGVVIVGGAVNLIAGLVS
jgi:uncharacterized membrane protein